MNYSRIRHCQVYV